MLQLVRTPSNMSHPMSKRAAEPGRPADRVKIQAQAATLVVLDPLNLGGASLEEDGAYQLDGFAPGTEKARLLFPRSCINRKFESYNGVSLMAVQGDSIKIDVNEKRQDADAVVIYRLDKNLRLVHSSVSDRLRTLHRELEAAGRGAQKLALMEEAKTMPFGAVWDMLCLKAGRPAGGAWISEIEPYEKKVLAQRQ